MFHNKDLEMYQISYECNCNDVVIYRSLVLLFQDYLIPRLFFSSKGIWRDMYIYIYIKEKIRMRNI